MNKIKEVDWERYWDEVEQKGWNEFLDFIKKQGKTFDTTEEKMKKFGMKKWIENFYKIAFGDGYIKALEGVLNGEIILDTAKAEAKAIMKKEEGNGK